MTDRQTGLALDDQRPGQPAVVQPLSDGADMPTASTDQPVLDPYQAWLAARADSIRSNWTTLFLAIVVFGVHTNLSAPALPHTFLAFLGGCGILVVNYRRYTRQVVIWLLAFVVVVEALGILSHMLGGQDIATNARSGVNFCYDVFTGLNVFIGVTQMGLQRVRKFFFVYLLILVIGSGLELVNVTKSASDWFREHTVQSALYVNDDRDIQDYGGMLRPKFFGSEPARLGETMSICFCLWLAAIRKPNFLQWVLAIVLFAASLFIVRSPVIVFGFIAYLLVRLTTLRKGGIGASGLSRTILLAYSALGASLPVILAWYIDHGANVPKFFTTGSFYARVIAPYYMALEVLQQHAPFGVGFVEAEGDTLAKIAIYAYAGTGALFKIPHVAWAGLGGDACNAFWFSIISLGICGSLVLLAMLFVLFRIMRLRIALMSVACITCFTYWLMFGRPNAIEAWETFFLIAAICELRLRNFDFVETT